MRVRIIFLLKNKGAYVPFHHQYLLAELKEAILAGGEEKYLPFTGYNFSGLKGQTKVGKNGLHFFSSRVTLVMSSPDDGFINYFLQRLFERKELQIGSLVLIPEMVEKEILPEFTESIKCVCISPVVLIEPFNNDFYAKKFISPDSDIFSDLLYESTMNRMEQSGSYSVEQIAAFFKFQIVPDKDYLEKIKEGEKKFARIYPVSDKDGKHEVRGYTFPFTLFAAPDVQEFLFNCGLGAFAYRGFGMLDIVNADLGRKTEPYQLGAVARVQH